MKTSILSEKINPLFNRKEVLVEIDSPITPSYKEILDDLSKRYHLDQLSIKIVRVHSKFGTNKFKVHSLT